MLEQIEIDSQEGSNEPDTIKKKWRAKIEAKSLELADIVQYLQKSAPYFLSINSRKDVASEIGESP